MPKAYVMMNCDLGSEKQVIADLKKINGVKEAHGTLGMYDIIAQIEVSGDDVAIVIRLLNETTRKFFPVFPTSKIEI